MASPEDISSTCLYAKYMETTGYKFINITNNHIFQKGSLMYVYTQVDASLAVNRQSGLTYSDFDWEANTLLSTTSPAWTVYLRIYTEPANQVNSYVYNLEKTFSSHGTFNVIANTFTCSGTNITKSVSITVISPTSTSTTSMMGTTSLNNNGKCFHCF